MDKTCHSSADRDEHLLLKQLNKLSHKISKTPPPPPPPTIIKKLNASDHQNQPPLLQNLQPPPLHQQQQQPPVYNINKNDFRDVVQKLTGSPAHERSSAPHPTATPHPRPPSSRLQRIRPPPLEHVTKIPSPMLSSTAPPIPPPNPTVTASTSTVSHNNSSSSGNFIKRPSAPLSPLPPLPAVHAVAESPVSAYMRYLQNSISAADPNSKSPQLSGFSPMAPLVSPRWSSTSTTDISQQRETISPPSSQHQMPDSQTQPQSQTQFLFPSSLLSFGYLNSPPSPYPLLSPSFLLSPTSGQLNFPVSPTVPVPSPLWRGL